MEDCLAELKSKKGVADAGGVRISYHVWEQSGPDVVMVHGLTSNALSWWRVAPEVARAGFRVIALDMPGHGDSGQPTGGYALAETARILDAFMAGLGVSSPIVVGHSWGGTVTLVHATESDMRVSPRSIVLVDPLLRAPTEHAAHYREAMLQPLGKPRQELAPELRAAYPNWHDCDVYWKAEALEKATPAALRGVFDGNVDIDMVSRLSMLPCAWFLLIADPAAGGIVPDSAWSEIQEAAERNDGLVRKLPGVGHDMHREDFEGFVASLDGFLAGQR